MVLCSKGRYIVKNRLDLNDDKLNKALGISTKINLCDECSRRDDIPVCIPIGDDIKFGDGFGDDNVIECTNYVEVEK